MSEKFPVYVITATDRGTEKLRIGTATRIHDGFVLNIETSMNIGAAPVSAPASPGGAVFPPYGRSKGKPVSGATMEDLEYYAAGCRRTLGDPAKSRWHDKERVLLAAIEAEMARHGGQDEPPPLGNDDVPF